LIRRTSVLPEVVLHTHTHINKLNRKLVKIQDKKLRGCAYQVASTLVPSVYQYTQCTAWVRFNNHWCSTPPHGHFLAESVTNHC